MKVCLFLTKVLVKVSQFFGNNLKDSIFNFRNYLNFTIFWQNLLFCHLITWLVWIRISRHFSSHPMFSFLLFKYIVASRAIQFFRFIKNTHCLFLPSEFQNPITLWIQGTPNGFEVFIQKLLCLVSFSIKKATCLFSCNS